MPFSFYLWMAVIASYFVNVAFYKILRFLQSYVEGSLNDKETTDETLSEVFLAMIGVFVLQSVKMKYESDFDCC